MIINAKIMTEKEIKELDKKKLIDVNDFEKFLQTLESAGAGDYSTDGIISMLEKQPAVDAVEVVRCKDCEDGYKRFVSDDTVRCENDGCWHNDNWFCAGGKRKSNRNNSSSTS